MSALAHQLDDDAALVTEAMLRAASFLKITLAQLAQIIGVSESSMKNYSRGSATLKQAKAVELALGFIRVYRALYAILGGDQEQMWHWLQTPNRHLRDQVPLKLLLTYQGLAELNGYLDAMRGRL